MWQLTKDMAIFAAIVLTLLFGYVKLFGAEVTTATQAQGSAAARVKVALAMATAAERERLDTVARPPVTHRHQSGVKTCLCSPDCTCGCNDGQPCRCGGPVVRTNGYTPDQGGPKTVPTGLGAVNAYYPTPTGHFAPTGQLGAFPGQPQPVYYQTTPAFATQPLSSYPGVVLRGSSAGAPAWGFPAQSRGWRGSAGANCGPSG
jgi:hypothetical protein